jgi:hypothetical protein
MNTKTEFKTLQIDRLIGTVIFISSAPKSYLFIQYGRDFRRAFYTFREFDRSKFHVGAQVEFGLRSSYDGTNPVAADVIPLGTTVPVAVPKPSRSEDGRSDDRWPADTMCESWGNKFVGSEDAAFRYAKQFGRLFVQCFMRGYRKRTARVEIIPERGDAYVSF